jgi:hypothetical protein
MASGHRLVVIIKLTSTYFTVIVLLMPPWRGHWQRKWEREEAVIGGRKEVDERGETCTLTS